VKLDQCTQLPFFTGDVDPCFPNCVDLATYYSQLGGNNRPENLVQLEGEYYRQKKLRFLVLLFKLLHEEIYFRKI